MGNEKNKVLPEYPIRGPVAPGYKSGDADSMSFEHIKQTFSKLNPGPVQSAADAFLDASNALAEMADAVRAHATAIKGGWQGKEAQAAIDQLEQVNWTAHNVHASSLRHAQVYTWYKTEILDWYKAAGQHMTDGMVNSDNDNRRARDMMVKLMNRTSEAHNAVPEKIQKDLPDDGAGDPGGRPSMNAGPTGGAPSGGPGGGPGGGLASGKFGGGPGGLGVDTANSPFTSPNTNGPHLSSAESGGWKGGTGPGSGGLGSGGGTNLAGMDGAGGGSLNPFGSGPGGGPGGGGLGGGPAGGGPGPFGGGPGGAFGAGVPTAGAPMGRGLGTGAGTGAGAAGRAGMGGMPMGGGPQGNQGDQERERTTWLTEDEDVWGSDDDTAPPVIG